MPSNGHHKKRSGASTSHLPGYLARGIEEAGASAYRWHDEELLEHVDPSKTLRRTADILHKTSIGAWYALVAVLGFTLPYWWIGVIAVLVAAGGLFVSRFRTIPTWASMMVLVVAWCSGMPAAVIAVSLVTFAGAWASLRPVHRWWFFSLASLLLLASGSRFDPAPAAGAWLTTGIVVLLLVVVLRYTGMFFVKPWGRVPESALKTRPTPPPSRLPLLIQLKRRDEIADEPKTIRNKRIGADGERRTAIVLMCLAARKGTRIVHDVMLPGAKTANVDHAVLALSGGYPIDTKRFGSVDDPGLVTVDAGSNTVVHRSSQGARSIESSLSTIVWAAKELSKVLGVPMHPLLLVQTSEVSPGLVVTREGVKVEILPMAAVLSRIDGAPAELSRKQMAVATVALMRLRSADRDGPPMIVAPRGVSKAGARWLDAQVPGAVQVAVANTISALAQQQRRGQAQQNPSDGPGETPPVKMADKRNRAVPTTRRSHQETRQAAMAHAAKASATLGADNVVSGSRAAVAMKSDVEELGEKVVPTLKERIAERWSHMEASEPAAPDDVPVDLRGIRRGTPILVVHIGDGEITEVRAVAMSEPCFGGSGSFVWFCSPRQWAIYRDTGEKVRVSTVSLDSVHIPPGVAP